MKKNLVKQLENQKQRSTPSNIIQLKNNNVEEEALGQDEPLHLYMVWNPSFDNEQMYHIKNILREHGESWIGKVDKSSGKDRISPIMINALKKRLEDPEKETLLYMTNFRSIHVYKISKVQTEDPRTKENNDKIFAKLYQMDSQCSFELWIQVTDVYVLAVDDPDTLKSEIYNTLEKLEILTPVDSKTGGYLKKTQNYVSPFNSSNRYPVPVTTKSNESYFKIVSSVKDCKCLGGRWYNISRNVTKSYKLCELTLKKNNFNGVWNKLNPTTQHYLVECESKRIESCYFEGIQAFSILRQAWECYIRAVVGEIYQTLHVDINPLLKHKFRNGLNDYNLDFDLGTICKLLPQLEQGVYLLESDRTDKKVASFLRHCKSGSDLRNDLDNLRDIRNLLAHRFESHQFFESAGKENLNLTLKLLHDHLWNLMLPNRKNLIHLILQAKGDLAPSDREVMFIAAGRTVLGFKFLISELRTIFENIEKEQRQKEKNAA